MGRVVSNKVLNCKLELHTRLRVSDRTLAAVQFHDILRNSKTKPRAASGAGFINSIESVPYFSQSFCGKRLAVIFDGECGFTTIVLNPYCDTATGGGVLDCIGRKILNHLCNSILVRNDGALLRELVADLQFLCLCSHLEFLEDGFRKIGKRKLIP